MTVEIIIGIGVPLYFMRLGKKSFKINSQFEYLIDSIKKRPRSQRDVLKEASIHPRTIIRHIRMLEKHKLLKNYYLPDAKGRIKMLMLNPNASFREVIVDPRWKF